MPNYPGIDRIAALAVLSPVETGRGASDDLTSSSGRDGGFATGHCETRILG